VRSSSVDNSTHSDWAVDRPSSCPPVNAASPVTMSTPPTPRRPLPTARDGSPARFQTPEEIKKQRKIHDK